MGEAGVTELLREVTAGSDSAVNRLLPLVYDELRALAEHYLRAERPDHTLQATALVNEAYLRLVDQRQTDWADRNHFFAIAAQAIRRVLVDHARGKNRQKRGGDARRESLDDAIGSTAGLSDAVDLLALDEALNDLSRLNERQARIVELRFFGGLAIEEIAELVGASPRTVDGDWAMARAWLRRALAADA